MSINVLIADDYPPMRLALRRFLEETNEMVIVGEAVNGQEAVQQCLKSKPDVVTMDVQMPVVDGVQATTLITQLMPKVAILALSGETELWCVHKMFTAGASGYVLKDCVCEDLEAAIRTLASGRAFLGRSIIDRLLSQAIHTSSPLAQREATVLRGLAQGKDHEQIALDLCLTPDTVRHTLRSIRRHANTSAIECLVNHIETQ